MVSEKTKKAVIIGGTIAAAAVAGALVYKALAKPSTVITPPPSIPPTPPSAGPSIPVGVEAINYPTSLIQYYGFYYPPMTTLQYWELVSLVSIGNNVYTTGAILAKAIFKVVDATGAGVSGIQVDCWANALTDDQGGQIDIEGASASVDSPVTKTTDANGEVYFLIGYHLTDFSTILAQHNFGCCLLGSRVGPLGLGGHCGNYGLLPTAPCYSLKNAVTQPRIYTVTAGIHGTVLQANFAVGLHVESEALW